MATKAGSVVLAERYASALLDVALDKGLDLDAILAELESLVALLSSDARLAHALSSPGIPTDKRVSVLDAILDRAQLVPATDNLLRLLVLRERMTLLPIVSEQYQRLLLEHRKVQPGDVTSAVGLTDEQKARLAESLGHGLGKTMALTYHTDKTLVGGLVVRIGNRVYDASVLSQLARLKEQALAAG